MGEPSSCMTWALRKPQLERRGVRATYPRTHQQMGVGTSAWRTTPQRGDIDHRRDGGATVPKEGVLLAMPGAALRHATRLTVLKLSVNHTG